ncbi:MAG TPA: hypothetical protein VG672_03170, partial [Bryobacteraceae bacterium]|nr:hypothetical protein [Bryobacteraceae bacterium]
GVASAALRLTAKSASSRRHNFFMNLNKRLWGFGYSSVNRVNTLEALVMMKFGGIAAGGVFAGLTLVALAKARRELGHARAIPQDVYFRVRFSTSGAPHL